MTRKVISFPAESKKSNTTSDSGDSLQLTFQIGRRQHVLNLSRKSAHPERVMRNMIVLPKTKKRS